MNAIPILSDNFGEIEKKGRRRLLYEGTVTSQKVATSIWRERWGVIEAATISERSPWRHTVYSSESTQLSEPTILHELCHAKLNECGFLDVQDGFRQGLERIHGNDYDKSVFRETLVCVAEAYAEWLCHTTFAEESREKTDTLLQAIGQDDALLNTYLNGGPNGLAEILSTQTWFSWCSIPYRRLQEPWNDWAPMRIYRELQLLFAGLPLLARSTSLDPISDSVKVRIVCVSASIFELLCQSS